MSRKEILSKLSFTVPQGRSIRLIIMTDLANEADDPYAVMHILLSPTFDVKGIVAGHFEYYPKLIDGIMQERGIPLEKRAEMLGGKMAERGSSMLRSMAVGKELLSIADMTEVPLLAGSRFELNAWEELANLGEQDRFPADCWQRLQDGRVIPTSPGADLIIEEALKDDPRPLYVTTLGGVTDLAIAVLKCPEASERMTAVLNGGAAYPAGGEEFNFHQDIPAVNVLMESKLPLWQIPSVVYSVTDVSFARLQREIRPCGPVGAYLYEETIAFHQKTAVQNKDFGSEGWCLGDNSVVYALLIPESHLKSHMEDAPMLQDDLSYGKRENAKKIRVIDAIDPHYILTDLIEKLSICYPNQA